MSRFDPAATGLPLAPRLREISAALRERGRLVLQAPPGTGKSTLLPAFLLDEGWLAPGRILMLEPRRVAAAATASRVAELRGSSLGAEAGYRVRGDSRVAKGARLEVITEGLLVRMMQGDPALAGVSLLVFDEFHERSIHSDLALALALDIADMRAGGKDPLSILVMSATIEGRRAADFIGAELLEVDSPFHPVATEYAALRSCAPRGGAFGGAARRDDSLWPRGAADDAADAVVRLLAGGGGDVLCFLPGMREIKDVEDALRAALRSAGDAAEVLTLHGSAPLAEQRRVVAGGGKGRRVVLATNIAETSLTVAGVRAVVDSGLARVSRFHAGSGMDRVAVERIGAASADQRRGRAGRLGPGRCVRLWPEAEELRRSPDCEIRRADLSALVLEAARWGARSPGDLRFLDPPAPAAWDKAADTLALLGLLDPGGGTSALGGEVLARGLGPRLGLLAVEGRKTGEASLACLLAAFLGDRDLSGEDGCDLGPRIEALIAGKGQREWRQRTVAEAERIARAMDHEFAMPGAADLPGLAPLLLAAFPDRLGKRAGEAAYKFVPGRQASLPAGFRGAAREALFGAEWIVAPEVDPGEREGTIRLALAVDAALVEGRCGARAEARVEVEWAGLQPRAFELRAIGAVELSRRRVQRPDAGTVAAAFMARLAKEGAEMLPWTDAARGFLERARFLLFAKKEDASAWSDLAEGDWLLPWLDPSGGPVLDGDRLLGALRSRADAAFLSELARSVPERLELPSGASRRIDYSDPARPTVSARAQDFYGLDRHPACAGVPIVVELLSPAQRPVQRTADLPGYWRGSWRETRAEMRGRYPRHEWPEEPWKATAKPRGRRG